MKKLMIFGLLMLSSCTDKEETNDIWKDKINPSPKYAELSAKTDSVSFTTEYDGWTIDHICIEDSSYRYFDSKDFNFQADTFTLSGDVFYMKKSDGHTLFVRLNQNNTGQERYMSIDFQSGNFFEEVSIKQAAN